MWNAPPVSAGSKIAAFEGLFYLGRYFTPLPNLNPKPYMMLRVYFSVLSR